MLQHIKETPETSNITIKVKVTTQQRKLSDK